ncbi:MAG: hypothetical protein ACOYU2_04300 [Nitrospirota bacterium]
MGIFDFLFGKSEPKEKIMPVLKPENLQPADAPISTTEAKRIFREWMLKIGYLDKEEVADHVKYFADEIKEQDENFKIYIDEEKDDIEGSIDEEKAEIKSLKEELKGCKDPQEKEEILDAIKDCEANIADYKADLADRIAALKEKQAAFKADKREFLINYINTQVHGPDWKETL